ncbi:hypothetical protein CUU64_20555 [Bacillus sp. V5-8f]|nr:hypothetical protein CUU64_20555 [Bacillus sp. V5-8f]
MEIVNLFSYRVTDSSELKKVPEPVGKENNYFINKAVKDAELKIVGWGKDDKYMRRNEAVLNLLTSYKGKIKCFTDSRGWQLPRHPRRLKKDFKFIDYSYQ